MALTAGSLYTNGSTKAIQPTAQASVPAVPEPEMFNATEVVGILKDLMVKVTTTEVNAATVTAACQCASQITNLLRLHLEAERFRRTVR